jgi:hypothetical protein
MLYASPEKLPRLVVPVSVALGPISAWSHVQHLQLIPREHMDYPTQLEAGKVCLLSGGYARGSWQDNHRSTASFPKVSFSSPETQSYLVRGKGTSLPASSIDLRCTAGQFADLRKDNLGGRTIKPSKSFTG